MSDESFDFMVRPDRVMRAEAGVFERSGSAQASKAYTARRAEILFDLDRRARAQAEAAETCRNHNRPWRRLTQWRGR